MVRTGERERERESAEVWQDFAGGRGGGAGGGSDGRRSGTAVRRLGAQS